MDLNNIRIDETKEAEGVWVEVDTKTKFLIGSSKGLAYRKALRVAIRKRMDELDGAPLSEEEIEDITNECMAGTLLLGWEGLTEGGEEMVYSALKARAILTDTAYRQLREFVASKADDISLFRDTTRDNILDEVKKSQSGESNGAAT